MTPRYGGRSTYGTRYFDICWFLCNLFRRPIYEYAYLGLLSDCASSFLHGYGERAGTTFSSSDLYEYHRQFFSFRRTNRSQEELFTPKRILLSAGYRIWDSYMRLSERKHVL
jgi:hypothetical protein